MTDVRIVAAPQATIEPTNPFGPNVGNRSSIHSAKSAEPIPHPIPITCEETAPGTH